MHRKRRRRSLPSGLLVGGLCCGLLLAQVPGESDPHLSFTRVQELLLFRDILHDPAFQQEVATGFSYGPCRVLRAGPLTSGVFARGYGLDLHGELVFGEDGVAATHRLQFLYRVQGKSAAQLWLQTSTTTDLPPASVAIDDEVAFAFLVHVLDVLPAEITDPLARQQLLELVAEHEPNPGPQDPDVRLRLNYGNSYGGFWKDATAEIVTDNPLEFGSMVIQ